MSIDELCKSVPMGNVNDAIQKFQQMEDSPMIISQYHYTQFSKYLYDAGYALESIRILKRAEKKYPGNPYVIKSIVPKIYNKILKPFYSGEGCSEKEYMSTLNYIDSIIPPYQKNDHSYIYFKHVDYLEKKNQPDFSLILASLKALDESKLDKNSYKANDTSYPSAYEKWVVKVANAQFKLKLFQDCIKTVDRAFFNITVEWHYNQEIWLKRLKAISLLELKKYEEAIDLYKSLLINHPTWFMLHELAKIYAHLGEDDNALFYGAKACLSRDSEPTKSGKLYQTMFQVLQKADYTKRDAFLHLAYYIKVYQTNNFQVPNTLIEIYKQWQETFQEPTNLQKELEKCWMNIIYKNTEKYVGKIVSIHPNGRSGFIEYAGNRRIHFRFSNLKFSKRRVKEELHVSFVIGDSYDHARKRLSQTAELICEVKE